MKSILQVSKLRVKVGGREPISGLELEIKRGEVHGLTGKNGSGKSSLAMTLMGSKAYQVMGGKVLLDSKDLLQMEVDERAQAGLYVAWQNPVTIPGVSVFTLLKEAYRSHGYEIKSLVEFRSQVEVAAKQVGLKPEYLRRGVNEAFSGGEKKRLELLQMLVLKPKLVILDEIDSGMDEAGREMVARIISTLKKNGTSFLVISHYHDLLAKLRAEKIWELKAGKLVPKK